MTFPFFDFQRIRRFVRLYLLPALIFTVVIAVFANLIGYTFISGDSMNPTFSDGQVLVVLRTGINPFLEPKHGDIVIVNSSAYDTHIIKRVIGLPGDTVQLQGGRLYLNGQLQYEPYIYEPMADCAYSTVPAFTVPEGHYFILGDNRNNSGDSRQIGCVSAEEITCMVYPQYQPQLTALALVAFACIMWVAYRYLCYLELLEDTAPSPAPFDQSQKIPAVTVEAQLSQI